MPSFKDFDKKWNESPTTKFLGSVLLVVGTITFIAGFGAWKSPELNWVIFKDAFVSLVLMIKDDLVRCVKDPFAFLGILIMFVSAVVMYVGFKKLFLKSR